MTVKSKHSTNKGRFIGATKVIAIIAVLCILIFSAALKGIELYQLANAPTETPTPTATATLTATAVPTATAEPVYESLRLNQLGVEMDVCSREDIASIYQQFDDMLADLGAARQVNDMSMLVAWYQKNGYGGFDGWVCGETSILSALLENAIISNAVHAAAGLETHIIAETILPEARARIAADLTAMAEGEAGTLWIEQVLDQTHLCTDREALLWYDSIRPYKRTWSSLADVHDRDSLRRWLTLFDDWLSMYAAPFYNGGCHGGLISASGYEYFMYTGLFEQIIEGITGELSWQDADIYERLDRLAIAGR